MKRAWMCEYCGECYGQKGSCALHEENCTHNPHNGTCDTCKHMRWDPNGGKLDEDGFPEGMVECDLVEFCPYQRNCSAWESKRG